MSTLSSFDLPDEVEDFEGPLVLEDMRGRRPRGHSTLQLLRELTPEDLPALQDRTSKPPLENGGVVLKMRHAHHQLAQLIARGLENEEVSLITGYDYAYISRLKNEDPAFKELLAYYSSFEEEQHVDIKRRMNTLGLTAIELMQERLTDKPDDFSIRELLEIEKVNLVDPVQRSGGLQGGSSAGNGVNIQVNYVQSENSPKLVEGVVIDKKD